MTLLRLDREGGNRGASRRPKQLAHRFLHKSRTFRHQVAQAQRLSSRSICVDALEPAVRVCSQLRRSAINDVGLILLVAKRLERLLRFVENTFAPTHQLLAKIFALALVHKWLFVGRPVLSILSHVATLVLLEMRYVPHSAGWVISIVFGSRRPFFPMGRIDFNCPVGCCVYPGISERRHGKTSACTSPPSKTARRKSLSAGTSLIEPIKCHIEPL